jgi:hypothetical protein
MQALSLPPAAGVLELVGEDGLVVAVELLGLPQPAISSDAAPRAATILMVWRKGDLLVRPNRGAGKCGATLMHENDFGRHPAPPSGSVTER